MFGGFEDDPFFGSSSRMMNQMDSMMRSHFGGGDPFGGMMGGALMPSMRSSMPPIGGGNSMMGMMAPMNMMNPMAMMNAAMSNMDQMRGEMSSQSFSSSTMMTMTTGPDGKPQIYQSSTSNRMGPGGVRETKHSVTDSSTGVKKLAIGHHIGDRGYVIERERNNDGEEERKEFLNIDEEDEDLFENEFKYKSGRKRTGERRYGAIQSAAPVRAAQLAIEDGSHRRGREISEEDLNTSSTGRDRPSQSHERNGRSRGEEERYGRANLTGQYSGGAPRNTLRGESSSRHYSTDSTYLPSSYSRYHRPSASYSRPLSYSHGGRANQDYAENNSHSPSLGDSPQHNSNRHSRRPTPYN